jgi:hypothetical protein
MPQIILNQTQIIAAVGQRIAAAMTQHVRIDMKRQARAHSGTPDQVVNGRARKLIATLIEKEPGQLDLASLFHVALQRPEFLGVEWLFRGQAPFETLNPDAPMGQVDILAFEATEFGDAGCDRAIPNPNLLIKSFAYKIKRLLKNLVLLYSPSSYANALDAGL